MAAREFETIAAFLAFWARQTAQVSEAKKRGLEAAGVMLEQNAKAMIGEELREWPDLAASTVARKEARGQTGRVSDTDPLLATGELRASIGHRVDVGASKVVVGSSDPVMVFHEYGTSKMPPRPVIGATMFRDGKEAVDLVANHIMGVVAGKDGPLRPLPPHHDRR